MTCPPSIELTRCPVIDLSVIGCEPNEIVVEVTNLTIELGSISSLISVYEINEYRQFLVIDSIARTVFSLDYSPTSPENSKLFLNGQKMFYGRDYNIDGGLLLWSSEQELDQNDELEIYFY